MKTNVFSKILAMMLVVIMVVGILPLNVLAATAAGGYDDSNGGSDYYNVISEKSWDLAPGIQETELVLNNDNGTRRQVVHTAIVDMNNPYVKVIAGYKGMWPKEGNYGTQSTSVQALEAEKLGVGNVVVATNTTLSWYTHQYYKDNPHLIGEPLGYTILDGDMYYNSSWTYNEETKTFKKHAADSTQTIIIVNYDEHPLTGEPRPADIPKVWIRAATDPLTGWEEQAIPVSFTFLVKPDKDGNPVNQYEKATENNKHGTGDIASRTFVGVKADGTLVITVSDGEQAPFSTGFSSYEMAEYMIKMGCVVAANCDGGGSTTFCSQRPGEDLKVNCSLSDGGERPTTSTILVISTAPADGVFARATLSTAYDYVTPGSTVAFTALGTDAVGTKVDIPAGVQWQIKESGMGTIENGTFKSNGTEGKVTVQMVYDGKVVGEKSITVVTPDTLSFDQPIVTIPFGKSAKIPVKATASIDGVVREIGLGANDVTFATTNDALGRFDGLDFVAVSEANAPENITSTVTATLNMGTRPTATVQLNLGKGSEVLWGFEGGQADIDIWNVVNNRKNAAHWDYYLNLSLADRTNGQVHDGNYSMRLETNGLSSKDSHSEQYAWLRLGVDGEAITLKNAKRVGFWLYVPEDNIQCWVQWHYKTDSDGDGVFDTDNIVSVMESENVYYNIDESGWHYLSMDVSKFSEILLAADKQYDKDPSDGMTGEKGEFFLALVFHKGINNMLWQTNGSINGNYTYYLDNFTVDYSDAVEDRENPIFDKIYLDGKTPLVKRDVVETTNNILNLSAAVKDKDFLLDADKNQYTIYNVSGLNAATAKIYIDGVEVKSTFANGVLSATGVKVADGYHRVKFEICDNAGNKSVMIRVINVKSGSTDSTLALVPADPTLDRIPFGSIYWMNLEATAIETIQTVETVIDLNNVNHWQLDHMELAEGFTATYTINAETNTATITITRTGTNYDSGKAVLAKLPVRILYFDTDIKTPGYTAETYWTTYPFWAQDMKMDVDMGLITFTNGKTGTFSNEEFHVDTEMYTIMANMDKAYFAEHGTTHVHVPYALADKAATCTENGYTGRTFCDGCNSVVEWGTTISATGHTFKISGNKLACDCGRASNVTGLQTIDGNIYYAIAGKLWAGWQMIDDEWYYFDKTTFAGYDGEKYTDDAIKFTFDQGRVVRGTWVKMKNGWRYWYGPSFYRKTSPTYTPSERFEIDGKLYLFDANGYMMTGIVGYFEPTLKVVLCYDCGTDGVATLSNYSGPYGDDFYVNGIGQTAYKLLEYDGDYYFVSDNHKLAKNVTITLGEQFTSSVGLPAGKYTFDADGKMVIKNGPVGDYFYINNVMQKAYQMVEFKGDYYFISDGHKLAKDITITLGDQFTSAVNLPAGKYTFDAEGKLVMKNGPVGDYFYINNVMQKAYQMVEFEGDYYFISDGHKLAKDVTITLGEQFTSAVNLPAGKYTFDAEGKLVMKNGPVGDYFYINNVMQKAYQMVEFEGEYYFISDYHKLAKNTTIYLSETFTAAVGLPAGKYTFDTNGKVIMNRDDDGSGNNNPSVTIKNGPVGDYFYINNVMQKAYQVVEFNGNYYFISDYHKLAKNTTIYLSETFTAAAGLPAGKYTFDADGKMIIKNGPVGDYFYINDVMQKAYRLVEYQGNYYFINDGHKIAKNIRIYLNASFVSGKTYEDGSMVEVGYHYFDETGKMVY